MQNVYDQSERLTSEQRVWRKLLRQALDMFAIPPYMRISQWADEHRVLSSEASAKRGRWTSFPFQREPMDDALDKTVSTVVLMWASQTCGKTEVVNNIILYHIDRNPCPILLLEPTVEMGQSWSKERLTPAIRDMSILWGKIKEARSRDSNNTILHKSFPGGHLSIAGTNAPAGLSMRPIKIVMCDEVDRYPASAGVEGDPVALAFKRTETFPDAIKYLVSTPTIKGLSRIEKEFLETDKRYFLVPCHVCGHFQALKWAQVRWENTPVDARYFCENCNEPWTDAHRVAAILDPRAHWKATAEFKGKRGYHLNGLYTLFKPQKGYSSKLHQFAAEQISAAAKGQNARRTWTNTFLAEPWEDQARKREHADLMTRCENYPILPERALMAIGAGDTQEDRIECEFRAWGDGDESWGISYHRLMGNTDFDAPWNALFELVQRKFKHPSGKELPLTMFLIDCAFRPKQVFKFVHRCRNFGLPVFACRGGKTPWDETLCSAPGKTAKAHGIYNAKRATWFRIGTDHAKMMVYDALDVSEPGPRYMHFPIGYGYDEDYFKTLTAEELVLEEEDNILIKRFWRKRRDRNEALDINAYMRAILFQLQPNYAAIAKNLAIAEVSTNSSANADHKVEPKKEVAPPKTFPRFQSGFVKRPGSWWRR